MPYWQLFYHIVWSTQHRDPLLTAEVEPLVYRYLYHKALTFKATIHALNGAVDHVHLAVSLPPKVAVATFVGQIKGATSTRFNKEHPELPPLFWQDSYGVFSFDFKRLPHVVAYVENQKQHHAQGRLIPVLERTDESDPRLVRETAPPYALDDASWWRDMVSESPADESAG